MELSNRKKDQPAIVTISEGGDLEAANNNTLSSSSSSSYVDYDVIHSQITSKLLGPPLEGHRQFFYMLDPFYNTQLVRAPKMFDDINIYFGIIYFISILAFIVYAFYKYATQIPIQTNSMVLSSSINPIYVNISLSCSNPYQCGLWSNNSGIISLERPIVISQQWTSVDQSSPCFGQNSVVSIPATSMMQWSTTVTICYSESPNDGLLLSIPFNTSSAMLKVILTGSSTIYNNKNMYNELDINANQWKTAFVSQTKVIATDKSITYEPYVGDLFYNGHPPNAQVGYSSSVRLRLLQFSYLSVTSYQQNIFSTFGSIGGFASFSVTLLGMTRATVVMFYKSFYEINDSASKKGIRANACQTLFLCITKLLSFKT